MNGSILVTGAGGDIGIAVARCLREISPATRLVGADCRPDTPAEAFFDGTAVLPRAHEEGYLPRLEQLAREAGAELIIPLAEAELAELAKADLLQRRLAGAKVISANRSAVFAGLDKLETNRRLRAAGCQVPETGIVGEGRPAVFPVIVKPRSGQGSKQVRTVSEEEYAEVAVRRRGDLWQRLLMAEDEEFTCGIARFPDAPTRVISFRRRLSGGLTGSGTVVYDPRLEALGAQVANALDLRGSINMQLRIDNEVPMIFEVNPRFSSTVRFRHLLGFRDLAWSIEDALGYPIDDHSPPEPGARIFRVGEELILPPA